VAVLVPRFYVFTRDPDLAMNGAKLDRAEVRERFVEGVYAACFTDALEREAFAQWIERASTGQVFAATRFMVFAVDLIITSPWHRLRLRDARKHDNGEVT
jgi:hypothetical protein